MKALSTLALGLFLLATSPESALAAPVKVLVSVGDLKDNSDTSWKKSMCDKVHVMANQVNADSVHITCRSFDTTSFKDDKLDSLQKDHSFHLRVMRTTNSDLLIDATNWQRKHNSDFKSLAWKFNDAPHQKVTKDQAFHKAMTNFFFYVANEKAFKAGLLVNGAAESSSIAYDQKKGFFLDKATQEPISIDKAVTLFENESEEKKNFLRAGIEVGAMLSAGMAIYYKHLVFNQQDFDYGFREGIHKKLNGEAILFDDNDKLSNYGHVYAGVLYYQVARANGFNSLESFLITFASSAAWEFLEYHEVFSINDQILTPIGGYIIGEASYQISCALLQKGTAGKILGYTINPGMAMNHGIDKALGKNKSPFPANCAKPRWSKISVFLGRENGQNPHQSQKTQNNIFGLEAEVATIPDYNKPGQTAQFIYDTALVKSLVEYGSGNGLGDLTVIAQIVAAAYNQKDLRVDERGQLEGYDVVLGIGSASTWRDREGSFRSNSKDFYGTINILGASARANIFYKGMNIQAEFAFYGDFTMVKSWALDDFKNRNGGNLDDQLNVTRKRGYYWGLGTTTLAALSIERDSVKVGYNAQFSSASDISERHRYQGQIGLIRAASFKDSIVTHQFYVTFKITKNLSFRLAREIIKREGSANGISSRPGTERRTTGTLVYLF